MPWIKEDPAEGVWIGEKFFRDWALISHRYPYKINESKTFEPGFEIETHHSPVERMVSILGGGFSFSLFQPVIEVEQTETSFFLLSGGFSLEQKEPVVIVNELESASFVPDFSFNLSLDEVALNKTEIDSTTFSLGATFSLDLGV